ncbi:MAG: hypothetical protein ABSF66_06550 [Terriglobales bacterium]|jgi:hypothetical protein
MSTANELILEATATLKHGAAILRLASMETGKQETATDLWRRAKAVEKLVEPIEPLVQRTI